MHDSAGEIKSPAVSNISLYSRIPVPHGRTDSPGNGEVKNKIGLYW